MEGQTDFLQRRESKQPIGDHFTAYRSESWPNQDNSGKENRGHGGKF